VDVEQVGAVTTSKKFSKAKILVLWETGKRRNLWLETMC
jgi:hypothetical protein